MTMSKDYVMENLIDDVIHLVEGYDEVEITSSYTKNNRTSVMVKSADPGKYDNILTEMSAMVMRTSVYYQTDINVRINYYQDGRILEISSGDWMITLYMKIRK